MKRSMALGMKMGVGFGALVLVLIIVGVVSWKALSNLTAGATLLAKSDDCIRTVDRCGALRRDFTIHKFEKLAGGDQNAAEAWASTYDQLVKDLDDLKKAKGITTATQGKVDNALDICKPYKAAFGSLESSESAKDEAFGKWRKIGGSVTELLSDIIDKTIATGQQKAIQDKSIDDVVKWSKALDGVQELVVKRFLLLRTSALYLLLTEKDSEWETYSKQLAATKEGIAQWAESVKGEEGLQKTAAQIADLIKEYEAAGDVMHTSILKQRDANVDLAKQAADLLKEIADINADVTKGMDAAAQRANALSVALILFGTVLGIVVAIVTTLSITRPIHRVIKSMTSGAEQVSSASTQVSSASQSLAQGASEQASSLEETSSSLEEMASMTRQNADNANQANVVAKEASEHAEAGVDSMKRMSEAIDRIKNSASETAKIIKTIDEIAFQTNLLALNAAVEAARAGEAGKGFAVVAEEVRNLARRSAEAAKNTADLIEGAQKNAEAGVNVTAEVAKNLGGIKDSAGKVATLIAEIAAASKEQSQGIDQVNTAVAEMDKVVQQNAANAEESSSASEELSSQAQELNAMVADLVAIVGGSSADHAPAKTPKAATNGNGQKYVAPKVTAPVKRGNGNGGPHKAETKSVKPEQVIPLDEEELARF
jgi:methyl-accepting chemotaxis protein